MSVRVWVFDLDGVLIAPGGYRRAVVATVLHFAHRLGLEPPPPTEAVMAEYEAHGITSEWDMVPLMLAALLETAAAQGWPWPATWPSLGARPVPREQRWPLAEVPYARPAAWVGATLPARVFPAAYAWQRLQRGDASPFPHLARRPDLAAVLFKHSRDVRRSPLTRAFQHFVLGAAGFQETYGEPAAFAVASYLLTYDRPLPAERWLRRVYAAWQARILPLAVMTARPSRPHPQARGYAPEAEMALQRLGWQGVPLVGYGHVRAHPSSDEGLLKPHPAHALAALYAAWQRDATDSLAWALAVLQAPRRAQALFPQGVDWVVVEDSPPGLRAAQAAARVLRQGGVAVRLTSVGLATHAAKRQALAALGAHLAPHLDAAATRGPLSLEALDGHSVAEGRTG